jgi:hypothetical protein
VLEARKLNSKRGDDLIKPRLACCRRGFHIKHAPIGRSLPAHVCTLATALGLPGNEGERTFARNEADEL